GFVVVLGRAALPGPDRRGRVRVPGGADAGDRGSGARRSRRRGRQGSAARRPRGDEDGAHRREPCRRLSRPAPGRRRAAGGRGLGAGRRRRDLTDLSARSGTARPWRPSNQQSIWGDEMTLFAGWRKTAVLVGGGFALLLALAFVLGGTDSDSGGGAQSSAGNGAVSTGSFGAAGAASGTHGASHSAVVPRTAPTAAALAPAQPDAALGKA